MDTNILNKLKTSITDPTSALSQGLVAAATTVPTEKPQTPQEKQAAAAEFTTALKKPEVAKALGDVLESVQFSTNVMLEGKSINRSFVSLKARDIWLVENAQRISSVNSVSNDNVTVKLAESVAAMLYEKTGNLDLSLVWVKRNLGVNESQLMERMLKKLCETNSDFVERLIEGHIPTAARVLVEGKEKVLKGNNIKKLTESNVNLKQWIFSKEKVQIVENAKKGISPALVESILKSIKTQGLKLTESNVKSLIAEQNLLVNINDVVEAIKQKISR